MIKNQFKKIVKIVRTYNGAEFLSGDCQNLLNELGVIRERTCAYSPQQNGKVERRHRITVQIARSLIFKANLLVKFWGEAILYATYLLNRWPSIVLN